MIIQSPVHLEYDTESGHYNVWVAEIVNGVERRLWPSVFTTLGKAQVFFNSAIDGPSWLKREDGWVGEIRPDDQKTFNGHTILIHNLLMVKEL